MKHMCYKQKAFDERKKMAMEIFVMLFFVVKQKFEKKEKNYGNKL